MPSTCPKQSSRFLKERAMCSAQVRLPCAAHRAAIGRIAMNKLLLALGVLAASALLIPGDAEAQRGGRGGGGARVGGGGYRGGSFGGGSRMYIPSRGMSGARVGMGAGGYRGRAVAARPGGR